MTVASPAVAAAYAANFRELWDGGQVEGTGEHDTAATPVGDATVRPWFCPGRGEALAARIAEAVDGARRRVRIASPVLTAVPILEALDRRGTAGDLDVAGVCDATQIHQVFGQWAANPQAAFKGPLLRRVLGSAHFTGKRSTPYAPGAVHDYMHAKVTVVDDTVFCGSFNLSRSGQENAENVLEVHSPAVADRLAAFVDEARARYPDPPR